VRLVTTKVAFLNIAALVGLAVPVTDGLVPRLVFTGPPAATTLARASTSSGNLEVSVPRVPPVQALPGLCGALLEHGSQPSQPATSSQLGDLYAATGGTPTSAHSWCNLFISGQLRTTVMAVIPAGF
jgi:hypothetical protein